MLNHTLGVGLLLIFCLYLVNAVGDNSTECNPDKIAFATCLVEKYQANLDQDDLLTKQAREKLVQCFTTHNCEPPSFGRPNLTPVNVTNKLKKHWTQLPDSVQDCLRTQLRDRTVLKLGICSKNERNGSSFAPKNISSPALRKLGLKSFFLTKARVNFYLEKCQFERGGEAYDNTAACTDEVLGYVGEIVCERIGSCQFEKVNAKCLSPTREYRRGLCKCYNEQLKIVLRDIETLLKKSSTHEVTVEELSTAMGQDESDLKRDKSAIKKCFQSEGLKIPVVIEKSNTTTSEPFLVSDIYTENIIVSREQLINVQMMLEARLDDEECKCET